MRTDPQRLREGRSKVKNTDDKANCGIYWSFKLLTEMVQILAEHFPIPAEPESGREAWNLFILGRQMIDHLLDAIHDIERGSDSDDLKATRIKLIREFQASLENMKPPTPPDILQYAQKSEPTGASPQAEPTPEGVKKYVRWAAEGRLTECPHGYADGIPCPHCDQEDAEKAEHQAESSGEKESPLDVYWQAMHAVSRSKTHAQKQIEALEAVAAEAVRRDNEQFSNWLSSRGHPQAPALAELQKEIASLRATANADAILAVERQTEIKQKDARIERLEGLLRNAQSLSISKFTSGDDWMLLDCAIVAALRGEAK